MWSVWVFCVKYIITKKTIYSLGALREVLAAAKRRYLAFISAIDDPSEGIRKLAKISETIHEDARSYRGFNFFDLEDHLLLQTIARGEFNISGLQNKRLRAFLSGLNSGHSRLLKRLRTHGLIKKANRCYKYYLTPLGRQVIALGLKLKNLVIVPELAQPPLTEISCQNQQESYYVGTHGLGSVSNAASN